MPKIKNNGFNIPNTKTTKCAKHIYGMIKEANSKLLDNEDVKKAFNDFVTCLSKYEEKISSIVPCRRDKYSSGIKIVENTENNAIKNTRILNCYFTYRPDIEEKEVAIDIINMYSPLYELIKRDVIPYMELKEWEITSVYEIEFCHNQIEKYEKNMKYHQDNINSIRRSICEYGEKALAAQIPPETTKFD